MPGKRKATRREFLSGQAAADALADATHGVTGPLSAGADHRTPVEHGEPSAGSYLLHYTRQAMACQFEVLVNAGQYTQAGEAAVAALDLLDDLESQLTVYRPDSEVMEINRTAAAGPVRVEPRLLGLLQRAVELHEQTDGAFDVTSGPLSRAWGFFRRQGRMPHEASLGEALARVGSRHLKIDPAAGTIAFDTPGLEINLGSIGKGYALDRMAERILDNDVRDFLLHGGSSSILARGSRDTASDDSPGWLVGIGHPLLRDRRLAELRLVDQALGTSGSGVQFFYHRGQRYGHILDPRTGRNATEMLSVTVVAPTAAEADALATSLFVLGLVGAREYCRRHQEVAALLILPGRRTGQIEWHAEGFSPGQLRFLAQD